MGLLDNQTQTQYQSGTLGGYQFTSLQNVSPSQLADTQLFDFESLEIDRKGERKEYEFELGQTISSSREKTLDDMVQIVEIMPNSAKADE